MGLQTWIPAQLDAYGVRYILCDGWNSRGSSDFTPRGLVIHHDAFGRDVSASTCLNTLIHGRSDLPGPLCQIWIDDDYEEAGGSDREPMTYVIAAGRANHAGSGGWKGLSGNSSVLGIEARNEGTGEQWSNAMLDTYAAVCAALLDGINADTAMLCGHKEWAPDRKIDPAGIEMNGWRNRVNGVRLYGRPPSKPPEKELGTPDMFIAIDSVGFYALCGSVLFTFRNMQTYGAAKNASPDVPALVIGNDCSLQDRNDLLDALVAQHRAATAA